MKTLVIVLINVYVIIGYIYVAKTMVFNKAFQDAIEWTWQCHTEISDFKKGRKLFLLLLKAIYTWPRLAYLDVKDIIR